LFACCVFKGPEIKKKRTTQKINSQTHGPNNLHYLYVFARFVFRSSQTRGVKCVRPRVTSRPSTERGRDFRVRGREGVGYMETGRARRWEGAKQLLQPTKQPTSACSDLERTNQPTSWEEWLAARLSCRTCLSPGVNKPNGHTSRKELTPAKTCARQRARKQTKQPGSDVDHRTCLCQWFHNCLKKHQKSKLCATSQRLATLGSTDLARESLDVTKRLNRSSIHTPSSPNCIVESTWRCFQP
jgi:hypothetical protein